jgi:hypothetical protein
MGFRIDQLTDRMRCLMSAEDQQAISPKDSSIGAPSRKKTDTLEREEQSVFANHCLRKGYAFVWHSTAHKTKASLGCPDFIVAVAGTTLWIEFKRPGGRLSTDQADFRNRLLANRALYWVVYSAAEAIALTSCL